MKLPMRVFLGSFGTLGIVVALPCIALMGWDILTSGFQNFTALYIILAVSIFAIPSLFAVYMSLKSPHPATTATAATATQQQENTERLILQMARIRNGRLSPTHVAMQTPLTIEQATQTLNELEQRGLIYSEVTIHGGTEFIFPDLLTPTTEFEQFDQKLAEENHIFDLDSPQPQTSPTFEEEQKASQTTNRT